jgi:signal transduction histidine kinase
MIEPTSDGGWYTQVSSLSNYIADAVTLDAAALGNRWRERVQATLVGLPSSPIADEARAERLVTTIARSLRNDPAWHGALMQDGLAFGATAYQRGASLHDALAAIDLLPAVVLYASERAAHAFEERGSAADGLAVARGIHRASSLLAQAATKGFTHAHGDALRLRYRMLRHDMRNPLGTIKTALSLMSDETMPIERRSDPRVRAMVLRNAAALETLIGTELGDSAAPDPALGEREVSLADVARSVRRDVREEALQSGIEIEVDELLPTLRLDATAFALALKSALTALLVGAGGETRIRISLDDLRADTVVVKVAADGGSDSTIEGGEIDFAVAQEVAGYAGGKAWSEDALFLELPISLTQARNDLTRAR